MCRIFKTKQILTSPASQMCHNSTTWLKTNLKCPLSIFRTFSENAVNQNSSMNELVKNRLVVGGYVTCRCMAIRRGANCAVLSAHSVTEVHLLTCPKEYRRCPLSRCPVRLTEGEHYWILKYAFEEVETFTDKIRYSVVIQSPEGPSEFICNSLYR